ncbi:hypothetical protein R1sor_017482 [Riccia sorocarpa]|uniref:Uncharacterized protein n=1 Tax=Riccia sorocarpa TaxID=122646 RepID=A0ABD3IAK2_9MARC
MSSEEIDEDLEAPALDAYEAMRSQNIAIRKQLEAQIRKDNGIETILTRPIKRSGQVEKPVSVKPAVFLCSPALTRSRTHPGTTDRSNAPNNNIPKPSKEPTTTDMNASGAFGGNGVHAYMTGNQGWTYTVQHPNAWMQVTCDQNEARRNRRAAKRKFQEEMTQRKEQGLKPCKVTVDHRGYVEGGKDEWYADLKALCLNYLDISIPQFAKQNTARVQLVKRDFEDRYQYDGGELSDNFVKGGILQILKGERNRLKMLWEEVGESKLDTPCPEDVEPTTWKKLIQYWTSAEEMVKSDQASNARAQVVNLNTTGRAGYHSSIRQMVSADP